MNAGIEALMLAPVRTENRRRLNPDPQSEWRERLRALEAAMRVRKLPRSDQQSAALIALALRFVSPTDHLWSRPAPSATTPGAASNSDIVRALQAHGKGHEADVATGRAAPRDFDPVALARAGIGQTHRSNPAGRFPRSTEVQTLLFDKSAFNVTRAKEWAKAHGYRTSGTDIGGDRATKIRLRQRDPEEFAKGTFRTIEFEPGIEAVIAMPKKGSASTRRKNPADGSKRPTRTSQVDAYLAAHGFPGVKLHRSARDAYCHFYGGETDNWYEAGVMVPRVSDLSLDQWLAEARRLSAAARRNPALRRNPMTADLASMDFDEFAKHVVIGKGYNTLSGRRFVRVHSRDNAVMTDVPVSDGDGGKPLKRAVDIKRRAYDQLRMHLVAGHTLADRAKHRR